MLLYGVLENRPPSKGELEADVVCSGQFSEQA